jgi:hypothetical protein
MDHPGSPVIHDDVSVSKPGDQHEQEADRVSAKVMQMRDPQGQSQRTLANEDAEVSSLRKEISPPQLSRHDGEPLPGSERFFFEPRFGYDFSNVRIHHGTEDARNAEHLNAFAFSCGIDVSFGAGMYAPGTNSGRHLLAHELTHVIQQGGARAFTDEYSAAPAQSLLQTPLMIQRAPAGSKKEKREKRKLLEFLASVKANEEIQFSKRNARTAARILELAEQGTPEFALDEDIRNRLLVIRNQGVPVEETEEKIESDTDIESDSETEEGPTETVEESTTGTEEQLGESSNLCEGFSYNNDACQLRRALEFNDFSPPEGGAELPGEDAHVPWGLEAEVRGGKRFYRATLDVANLKMEKEALEGHNDALLAHERIHWGIPCKLAQLGNAAIARGESHQKIDAFILNLANEFNDLNGRYDTETRHRLNIGAQMSWNDRWCVYVEEAFNSKLGSP